MPTFKHGKNATFSIDGAASTLVDISATLNTISMPRAVETAETTAFGTQDKTYIVGLSDATISISGMFDQATDVDLKTMIANLKSGTLASASFEYGPMGSTSTYPKFTGECIVTAYDISSPVGDVLTYSLELQVTGAITQGVYA
jgi:predicted secreted protein